MKIDEIRKRMNFIKKNFKLSQAEDELIVALDMLDEAKEVIEFYGNEKNWVHITKDQDGSLNSWRRKYIDDEEMLLNYKWPCGASGSLRAGGKRARELLKKWEENL